jgi:hypothetical protein
MKMLIAVLAASLTLAFAALSLGPSKAEAATNYCKHRYGVCLARCQGRARHCDNRCQSQYRFCRYPYPYLGDLL